MYLKKAGTFIAAASMLVWFLSTYPHSKPLEQLYMSKIEHTTDEARKSALTVEMDAAQLEQSYLGRIGKAIEPLFTPIGLDWKLAVALQTGLAAKEVVVSTLGVLYSVGENVTETDRPLLVAIRTHIPFASAVAFIVVIMLYLPCLAASVVFTREAGGIRYFFYLFLFTSAVAYTLAFAAYHFTLVLTGVPAQLPG